MRQRHSSEQTTRQWQEIRDIMLGKDVKHDLGLPKDENVENLKNNVLEMLRFISTDYQINVLIFEIDSKHFFGQRYQGSS